MDRVPRRPTPRPPAPGALRRTDASRDGAETRATPRDDAPRDTLDDDATRAIARDTWDDAETRAIARDTWDDAETRAIPRDTLEDDASTRVVRRDAWPDDAATSVSPVVEDDAATRVGRAGAPPDGSGIRAARRAPTQSGPHPRGPGGRSAPPGPRRARPAAEVRPRPADAHRRSGPEPDGASVPSRRTSGTDDAPPPQAHRKSRPGPAPTDAERGTSRDGWPGRGTTRPLDDRARRRRPVPLLLVLVLAAIGAALLGWMGQTATAGTFRGSWEFSRLGGPWLVAGFVGGAIGGWRRGVGGLVLGVFAGAVIVGAGSVAYYGLSYWDGGNDARRAAKLGIGWGAAGVAVGGTLGLVGAFYATTLGRHLSLRDGRRVGSWVHGLALGTLGGLVMGESIALLWVWDDGGLRTMALLEGLGGAAIVAVGAATRSWRFIVAAVVAAALAATVAPIATTMLRETLRTIGWAGA